MKFAITAGHSDKDPGACANGYKEAELAVWLRDTTADKLRQLGHVVIEDGENGQNLVLKTAISLAKTVPLPIEIHFNAAGDPTATGVEVIGLEDKIPLCQKLAGTIADVLGIKVRGHRGGYKHPRETPHKTLGFCNAGGIIIEVCFITNKAEMDSYRDRKWLVASAIARVLDEWSKS